MTPFQHDERPADASAQQAQRVSVAICTWNRPDLLARTLDCLAHAERPARVALEVLVVNNACSDDTSVVVASFAERLPLRETYEVEPGIAMARNRAVLESTGTHLAFIDDDILVEKTWLTALAKLVTRYPESAAFGGPVRAYFPEAPNPALAAAFPYLRRGFCGLDYNRQEGPLPNGLLPVGANMVFRKASLNGLQFDPRLGVKRDSCAGHEDVALLSRLRADGGSIMWSPQLSVGHYVDPSRTTAAYLAHTSATGRAVASSHSGCRRDGSSSASPFTYSWGWVSRASPTRACG